MQFSCKDGDSTARGGKTFARSLIRNDRFSASRPPCGGAYSQSCDSYADIYLDGSPTDSQFDSGDQGFSLLLEEVTQYVHSLATGYAFADQLGSSSVSEKDGILTFMWYLERYLYLARTQYPSAYSFLLNDTCWRNAIAKLWHRAEFYLTLTQSNGKLGINEAAIEALMKNPTLLAEMGPFLQCQP